MHRNVSLNNIIINLPYRLKHLREWNLYLFNIPHYIQESIMVKVQSLLWLATDQAVGPRLPERVRTYFFGASSVMALWPNLIPTHFVCGAVPQEVNMVN